MPRGECGESDDDTIRSFINYIYLKKNERRVIPKRHCSAINKEHESSTLGIGGEDELFSSPSVPPPLMARRPVILRIKEKQNKLVVVL